MQNKLKSKIKQKHSDIYIILQIIVIDLIDHLFFAHLKNYQ